jgi:hypothetical protein
MSSYVTVAVGTDMGRRARDTGHDERDVGRGLGVECLRALAWASGMVSPRGADYADYLDLHVD